MLWQDSNIESKSSNNTYLNNIQIFNKLLTLLFEYFDDVKENINSIFLSRCYYKSSNCQQCKERASKPTGDKYIFRVK